MKVYQRRVGISVVITLALLATACPSSSDLDKMAKASNELAHDTLLANQIVAEFFKAGKIPLDKKDLIANKLGVIGEKGNSFNDFLKQLDAKYPQGTVPPQDLALIKANLSELRTLYGEVFADLLPFGAESAVKKLGGHITDIEKVVK